MQTDGSQDALSTSAGSAADAGQVHEEGLW
jgi:hypothetical protein